VGKCRGAVEPRCVSPKPRVDLIFECPTWSAGHTNGQHGGNDLASKSV
jgi:hypothetical protein